MSRQGRYRFLHTLKRISIGGLAQPADGKFGDILLADVLTSYSKVFGDLFVTLCMAFSRVHSSTMKPNRQCGGQFVVPIIIAIPSAIRLRQCLIEYMRVREIVKKSGVSTPAGWGGQHLANALKYATAFPVVILSAVMRGYEEKDHYVSEAGLFRLWMLFVSINACYSFYWDVSKDWDLTLFTKSRTSPDHPFGLRRNLYFRNEHLYYGAIMLDLLLRCTWSLKLSPHLDHFNDLEGGIFVMELLEALRRWIWIFFRVETEWVRGSNKGPAPDDVLLTNYRDFEMDRDEEDE
jgi:EXS family